MKTSIHSVPTIARPFVTPFSPVALPVFFALAFLPTIFRLTILDMAVTNPLAALGPVMAGLWFATSFREIRFNVVLLGPIAAALFWSVNWLMAAGGNSCCATMTR